MLSKLFIGRGKKRQKRKLPAGRLGQNPLRGCHRALRCEPLEDRRLLSLGTAALLEGPAAGVNSDIVLAGGAWAATANAPWLHTTSSGNGDGTATFTFDANAGAAQTGSLTIAGQTLAVTQAGAAYVAANPLTLASSGVHQPKGVAVDASGNVYIADTNDNALKEWNPSTQMVRTLVSAGLNQPYGVAVDGSGNVYIADSGNGAIKEWKAATQTVSTLVSGLDFPEGVAVDASGNLYIADTYPNAIEEWNASTQTVSTLVSSGLSFPEGVAVDRSGNVYIADTDDDAIKEWNASTKTVSTLVTLGALSFPAGVAVDAAGNVYIADNGTGAIEEWNASAQTVSTLVSSGLERPYGRGRGRLGQRLHRRFRTSTRSRSGMRRPGRSTPCRCWLHLRRQSQTPRETSTSPIRATTPSRNGMRRPRRSAPWSPWG